MGKPIVAFSNEEKLLLNEVGAFFPEKGGGLLCQHLRRVWALKHEMNEQRDDFFRCFVSEPFSFRSAYLGNLLEVKSETLCHQYVVFLEVLSSALVAGNHLKPSEEGKHSGFVQRHFGDVEQLLKKEQVDQIQAFVAFRHGGTHPEAESGYRTFYNFKTGAIGVIRRRKKRDLKIEKTFDEISLLFVQFCLDVLRLMDQRSSGPEARL
jgi:hypothetical protein